MTVPEIHITRWSRFLLWLRHFARLAIWGADEGGHDPVEQQRIEWTRASLFEDWWLKTHQLISRDDESAIQTLELLRLAQEQYMIQYDELLERERRNRAPLLGTDYETG